MTTEAQHLLAAFETLDPAEQRQVATEILRRSAGLDDLSDDGMQEPAPEVFQAYDTEEASSKW